MASTLFVREALSLSGATTQLLLQFTRNRNLKTGDTLVNDVSAGHSADLRTRD
jgi:hypothetical protein